MSLLLLAANLWTVLSTALLAHLMTTHVCSTVCCSFALGLATLGHCCQNQLAKLPACQHMVHVTRDVHAVSSSDISYRLPNKARLPNKPAHLA